MKRFFSILLVSAAIGLIAVPAHATLIDRGGGMIYDTDLNITWLQDANYAFTTGYDNALYGFSTGGLMAWSDAVTWANNLVYGGYSDWRLPTSDTCAGYNCTGSEMGHLFYTELGNLGYYDTSGNVQPGWGLTNTGPFTNLYADSWSGTEYAPDTYNAWAFGFGFGDQYWNSKTTRYYAWAVRDGDVAAVPEPGTLMLLGSGLMGLVATRRLLGRRHG